MSAQTTLWNGKSDVAVSTNNAGTVTTTFLSKKEYGLKFNVKGAALNRAHLNYRIEFGLALNGGIAGALAKGEIVGQKVKYTKGGAWDVRFVPAVQLGVAPERDPMEVAKSLTEEQLLALLASKKTAPAAPANA